MTIRCPSTRTSYPLTGLASPATSGTPRPTRPSGFAEGGRAALAWYAGGSKTSLIPPPLEPPCAPSFQVRSSVIDDTEATSCVPPQATTCGLDAGKSAWARPSPTASSDPLSPDAHRTVTPTSAASWKAWSIACIAWAVQCFSAPPQLIEITDGVLAVSWTAAVTASRKPRSVFGAKYTAILAPGATEPAT